MCHLILAMPLLALPIFWLVPPDVSVPVYAVITLASVFVYMKVMGSMKKPVVTGNEALVGAHGEVVTVTGDNRYLVRANGELWTARGGAGLESGQQVVISSVEGLTLSIQPESARAGKEKG